MMIPIPRDIPLPLPASPIYLEPLLIIAFVAHLLFVNLLVGSSIFVLGFELRGRKDPDYDRLARELAATVTVNKSIAVVLGVAPLLLVSVLYTMHFYTANALTGAAWIGLIPAIAVTFLLLYLHKYSWDRMARAKGAHIGMLAIAVVLLLAIPLVFFANVNLMTFPDRWTQVKGFLDAVTQSNVLPRYLHFLAASLVVTSLFGVAWFGRASYPAGEVFQRLTRPALRRVFYRVALAVSIAQLVIGPVVLFTLPAPGINRVMLAYLAAGIALALPAVWMLWRELTDEASDRRFFKIVGLLTATVLCMALARHNYRYEALRKHRWQMAQVTDAWAIESQRARADKAAGRSPGGRGPDGKELFTSNCSGCHGMDQRLVGPSVKEIAQIYAGNPDGIVTWAKAPGKKRADYPQMPAMAAIGEANLRAIGEYMLKPN